MRFEKGIRKPMNISLEACRCPWIHQSFPDVINTYIDIILLSRKM
jgi:hypothetical protein